MVVWDGWRLRVILLYMCHLPTFKLFYNWGYFTFGGMNLCELLTGILIWGIIKVGMRNRSEIVEETFGRCSFAKLFCPIYMRCVWWFWGLYCQKRMESLSFPYSLLISVVSSWKFVTTQDANIEKYLGKWHYCK